MAIFSPPRPPAVDDTPEPPRDGLRHTSVLTRLLVGAVVGSLAAASGAPNVEPRLTYRKISPSLAVAEEDGRPCRRAISWQHVFPRPYLGDVYAQLSANPHQPTPVRITLSWGVWRKQWEVIVQPGMVNLGLGGTLLLFTKTGGVTGPNPDIDLDATVPVCVHFGTATDGIPEPSVVSNANPGWIYSEHGWK